MAENASERPRRPLRRLGEAPNGARGDAAKGKTARGAATFMVGLPPVVNGRPTSGKLHTLPFYVSIAKVASRHLIVTDPYAEEFVHWQADREVA